MITRSEKTTIKIKNKNSGSYFMGKKSVKSD